MRGLFKLQGEIHPLAFVIAAPAILLLQPAAVALAYAATSTSLRADGEFWVLPLRALARLPDLSAWAAALAFLFSLAVAWALAALSFRRASRAGQGYTLAAISVIPLLQLAAILMLALMPRRATIEDDFRPAETDGANVATLLLGLLAGMTIIVLGVIISALIFGAYGWGLFVLTPFLVGVTTAYIGNRRAALPYGQTLKLVLGAAALGCLALLLLALEGLVCILMAAPLGALAAAAGGAIGQVIALAGQGRQPLACVAVLPLVFAFEAAMPPNIALSTEEAIEIDASPQQVWRALTSEEEIGPTPELIFRLGLAYPVRGRISGEGVGAERLGQFSTGIAHERITEWTPARRLAFRVESQPPAMTEFSPYEEVHAPHVQGYFETETTRFDLQPLPGGRTRLVVQASHTLRLDPVLYWEPMARWTIRRNSVRVLRHIRDAAELTAAART